MHDILDMNHCLAGTHVATGGLAERATQECELARGRLQALSETEQWLEGQKQACVYAEAQACSTQQVLAREEEVLAQYTQEVRGLFLSIIHKIVLTNHEFLYLRVPSCATTLFRFFGRSMRCR